MQTYVKCKDCMNYKTDKFTSNKCTNSVSYRSFKKTNSHLRRRNAPERTFTKYNQCKKHIKQLPVSRLHKRRENNVDDTHGRNAEFTSWKEWNDSSRQWSSCSRLEWRSSPVPSKIKTHNTIEDYCTESQRLTSKERELNNYYQGNFEIWLCWRHFLFLACANMLYTEKWIFNAMHSPLD